MSPLPAEFVGDSNFTMGRMMRRIFARQLVSVSEQLHDIRVGLFYVPEVESGEPKQYPVISEGDKEGLRASLLELSTLCAELGLPVSCAKLKIAANDLPETEREFGALTNEFKSELMSKTVLMVKSDRAAYFEHPQILTDRARAAFPVACEEILNGARAYALDMDAACVFHCMRALEPVLAVLAADVGETVGVDTWQTVIERVEAAIRDLGRTLPRGDAKAERLKFLAEAAKEFSYFKDGWRNHVSHGRGKYTGYEARQVLTHVCAFVEHLSAQLHE